MEFQISLKINHIYGISLTFSYYRAIEFKNKKIILDFYDPGNFDYYF